MKSSDARCRGLRQPGEPLRQSCAIRKGITPQLLFGLTIAPQIAEPHDDVRLLVEFPDGYRCKDPMSLYQVAT